MTPLHRAALAYAAKGIPVFPCMPNGKQPMVKDWRNAASTDPAVINEWWSRWPTANIGMPTGMRSGFVVLDVDTKRVDGFVTLARLERDFGALPYTLTVTTPSGGRHLWFKAPGFVVSTSPGHIAGEETPGIDIQGDGRYVCVAPSTIDGRIYSVKHCAPAGPWPERWLEALSPPPKAEPIVEAPWTPRSAVQHTRAERYCTVALQDQARELAEAPAGTRNDRLWRSSAALAGLVHLGVIDTSDVRRAISWACSMWSERDSRKDMDTMERGLTFGLANPRHVVLDDRRAA